jgi:hypothetical protein
MHLHWPRAMEIGPCAHAAANRFIILVARIAEQEIVHRPLRARAKTHGR